MMKNNYLLALLGSFLFIVNSYAQLSDIHYLPPLKQITNNAAIRQQAFYLSTPETTPFDVQVYVGTNPVPVIISGLSNATPQLYDIPDGDNDISLVTDTNTGIVLSNSGLRFESVGGQEFYVNYRGRSNAQAASLTSKGRKALGNLFKWGGIPNRADNSNLTTSLGIMATEDGTVVDIYGYDPDCEFRLQGDADGMTNDNLQIVLNEGQTFVLEALKNETIANIDGWLGATIRSTKKIAISNGGLNTGVNTSSASRDTGIDQPVPESILGKEYVFVRGNGTNETEFPIIIATRNQTEIFVNGSGTAIATIDTGEYFEIPSTNYSTSSPGGNMYVETSEAVYAYQSLAGASIIRTIGMNYIAPVNCLLPDQVDNIPYVQDIDGLDFDGGITIIASTATPDANITVTDNTGPVTLPASTPVAGTSDWKTFYVSGLMGDVSVISTGPIAVGMFGANNNAGYAGYYSGFDTVPAIELDLSGTACFPGTSISEVTGGFDAYQWFQDGTILPGETSNTYMPLAQGDFFVRVTKGSCTYDSAIVSVYTCSPEIVLTKTVDATPVLEGDTVTFTITVEHLGVDPVTNLVINEALPSAFTLVSATPSFGSWSSPDWTIGTMYSGELHTLTVVATVNELNAATTVTNTVSNTQNETDGNTIPDDPTEDVSILHSEISVSKRDRDALDGSYDTVGEVIIYDLVVTNTGDTTLSNITITDPNIDAGSLLPASVATLAPGAFAVFTARHTITQLDIEADQVVNSATAQATLSNGFVISDLSDDPNDPTTTNDDPTITPIDQEGGLVLEKVAIPAPDGLYNALGEVIEYQLTVTNTGNVSLDNVTISDPNADVGSITPASIAKLEVGESAIFTAAHTIVPADFTAGNVTNMATVSGTEPVEGTVVMDDSDNPITATPNDPTVITIPQFARLEFTKEASLPSDGSYDTVGESIFYTLVVSSTGTVAVNSVNVVDPNADNIVLQSTTGTDDGVDNVVDNLPPGTVASFVASHVLTQEDLDSGQVTNSAIVGGLDPSLPIPGSITDVSDDLNSPSPNDDDPTIVALASVPILSLTKTADDNTNVTEGQTIIYTYVVENTGNVTIDNVSLTDMHMGDGALGMITLLSTGGSDDGTDTVVDVLPPGTTATYQAAYTITATDVLNQTDIVNTATATGTPRTGSFTDPRAMETVTIAPVLTICSDETLAHDLTGDVSDPSASFTWFATDNPNVTGETTTLSTSTDITDTLVNTSTTDQVVTYTVAAVDGVGFPLDNYTVQVTVEAIPEVATAPTDTICSSETLNHDLTADVNLTGVTFSWSAADNPNVTGETTSVSTDTSITDTLVNTSTSAQTVVYIITPTAAAGCDGNNYTYTVTVDPEPTVATAPTITICSDVALNHDLTGDVSLVGTTFSWQATDNPNITGETTSTSTTTSITDVLTNESGTVQVVTYTITPTSAEGCTGVDYTYTVTVDPESFAATAPTDTVCSDVALNHDLNGDVNLVGSSFSWSATANANVTGETTTTSTATSITDVLTNTSGISQTVIYTITPTSADGCMGDPYTYTVTVDSEPFVATAPTDLVCSDDALNHDLNGDVNIAGSSFSWSAAANANVTGETTATTTTSSITDVLTNTSGSVQTVVYTIIPTSAGGCMGDSYTYTVTVDPESFVVTAPTDTVCSDDALNHDLNGDVNVVGSSFSWSATANVNITGETTATSTTTSITDVLTNTSGSVQTVIYTITPTSPDGCIGDPYTYTVTVDPEPFVATAPTDTVCSDVALSHDLNGDVNLVGSSFSWSAAANANVTGETTSTSIATSITDVLTNTSGSPQTVIYTITPTSADGCVGDSYSYTVTVDSEPFVAAAPTDTVCSDVTLNHDLNGDVNVSGSSFSWSATPNANVTGETTTTSTTTSITDVLTNTTGSPQIVVYTVTPTSAGGCMGASYTYTVTIEAEPSVTVAPSDIVCSDVALSHDLTGDVDIPGSSFSWQATANPNITGETTTISTATSINDVLTNISGSTQVVEYTITPTSPDGCPGDAYTYTVVIDPEPFVATAPTDTVCSDVTLNHDLNGDVNISNATFSWSAASNANVTGETTSTSTATSITDVLTNTSGTPQTVIYTITPTSVEGCVGDPYSYSVTIDPEPFVVTAPTAIVCSDETLSHDLNGDVNLVGSSFSWSAAANANVAGETTSTSTATSITDVLTNTSGSIQTVVYTIIPTSAGGCIGNPYTYTVTVDPESFVAAVPTDTVCSDVALNHDLNGDVNVVGSSFSWSAAANANVTGETTSTSTSTSITDTLTNESGSVQTVMYTITPTSPDGCAGDPYTYTVTVDPEPFVATAPTVTVCSGDALSHDLTGDVNTAGSSFSWSAAANANVTGETITTTTTASITDVLTNTSGSPQTVIYTITPTSVEGCVGNSYTYTVTVDSEPFVATAPTDTVCSDVALSHDLNGDVNIIGSSFSWSAAANANVTGETISTTTTSSITDVLTNTSGSVQTVVYTITPTSPDGCVGDPYTYTVTVDPESFAATDPTDTICSDTALNHDLTGDVNIIGSSFSWSASANANVTGETTSTSAATSITDVLTNESGSVQTVMYTITPTSPDGCVGDPYTYTVTVDPEPFVATAPTDTLCSDEALSHDLTGDVNVVGSSFSWSAAANVNVTGETTSTSTTTSITDVLTNISGSPQTVIYTIVPTSPDGCVGNAYTYTVTLDAEPFVATAPSDTVCSDIALSHDLNGDVNIAGSSFSWSALDNANVTGETISTSTATSITDVLTNISGSVQTVVYTITPTSAGGCLGDPYTYTVTVNPEPYVTTESSITICSNTALNYDLNSDINVAGSSFSWTAFNNPNVTGETTTTSTTSTITDMLINTSTSPQAVVYAIIPESSSGCTGDVYFYSVTVNPTPVVAVSPTITICSTDTLNHNLTDDVNTSGTTFSWSAMANANVTGATTSTNTSDRITDTLINTSTTVQTVVYTITPTVGGSCAGPTYTYEVTVNPAPEALVNPIQTICSGTALTHDLTGDVTITGSTFSWVAAANPNVSGATTSTSTATSITDTLTNSSGSVQTVTYTITPTSSEGCAGSSYTYTVTVNPEPFVSVAPTDTICSTDTLNHDLTADVNLSGTTFSWMAAVNPNVTGASITPQSATGITDSLVNTGTETEEVVYTITPTSSDGCVGDSYTYTVTVLASPQLEVTKVVLPAADGAYDVLGEEVNYEIRITNRTETDITSLIITDTEADALSITTLPVLEGNTSIVITAMQRITQENLDAGMISSQANVRGVDFCSTVVDQDSDDPTTVAPEDPTVVTLVQEASLSLLKTANALDDGLLDTPGETITYTFAVRNTGNVTLSTVTISDAHVEVGSIIPATISTLAPNQEVLFQATYTLRQIDINRGQVVNTASVRALDPNGLRIEDLSDDPNDPTDMDLNGDGDPDDPTVVITPQFTSLDVIKSVDKDTYSAVGEVLTYTIEVTNTGNITLENVVVTDPLIDFTTENTIASLAPNEMISVEGVYPITEEDITAQEIANTAMVTAQFGNGSYSITEDSDDPLNAMDIDIDGDGDAEDATRSYLDTDGDLVRDIDDLDKDNDGITNEEEQNGNPNLDTDSDGIIDSLDPDADGDGLFDYIEAGHGDRNANALGALEGAVGSDGIVDRLQETMDDGMVNYEVQDTDRDGMDDFQDLDDDDDRIPTPDERPDPNGNGIPEDAQDSNGNGIPDYLEPNDSSRVRSDGVEVFTGMSPNGDGLNDVFVINNVNSSTEANVLEVYNRWGVQVYVSNNYGENDEFFRGVSEGRVTFSEGEELPVGTYYYMYTYTNEAGERKHTAGFLYINR